LTTPKTIAELVEFVGSIAFSFPAARRNISLRNPVADQFRIGCVRSLQGVALFKRRQPVEKFLRLHSPGMLSGSQSKIVSKGVHGVVGKGLVRGSNGNLAGSSQFHSVGTAAAT